MIISPATASELDDALAVLGGQPVGVERPETANCILVARRDGKILGAVSAQPMQGATGVILPARSANGDAIIEDALNVAAIEHLRGVKVIESFLSPNDLIRAASLLRIGFRHVTRVHLMRRRATPVPPPSNSPSRLNSAINLRPYPELDSAAFHQVLVQCHENSLDCPELQEVLTADEVIAGYRECAPATGQWWLAEWNAEPVGVLVLSGVELIFVGVVPERRGQRMGHAIVESACRISPELSLIVDERNVPAIQLYASLGFEVVGAREVFLKIISESRASRTRKSSVVEY